MPCPTADSPLPPDDPVLAPPPHPRPDPLCARRRQEAEMLMRRQQEAEMVKHREAERAAREAEEREQEALRRKLADACLGRCCLRAGGQGFEEGTWACDREGTRVMGAWAKGGVCGVQWKVGSWGWGRGGREACVDRVAGVVAVDVCSTPS